jgi:hypothetical protein
VTTGEVKLLPLGKFVSKEMGKESNYVFTSQLEKSHSLFKDITLPESLLPCGTDDPGPSFLHMGSSKAGLPWHMDDHTIYYSTFGRIHWLLAPAASASLSELAQLGEHPHWQDWPAHDWLQKVRPTLSDKANASITEHIQEPNEFFYVPASWVRAALVQTDTLLFHRTFCRPNEFGLTGTSYGMA